MPGFDDALRRAQSTQRHDSASQADVDAQMMAIAHRIYRELETATQCAFGALAGAGGEVVRATGNHDQTLGNAVQLLATAGDGSANPGRGLWVLEHGGLSRTSRFETKQHWWAGNSRDKRLDGKRTVKIDGQSAARVIRPAPNLGLWEYPPATERTYSSYALTVEHNVDTRQTTITHEDAVKRAIETATDYIAELTATRLAQLR